MLNKDKKPNSNQYLSISKLWQWTGFGEKKLWDWLQLLLAPAVLTFLGVSLNTYMSDRQKQIEADRYKYEELNNYTEEMADILLNKKLLTLKDENQLSQLKSIAQNKTVKTLTLLSSDTDRQHREVLLDFLRVAKLLAKDQKSEVEPPVALLTQINLSGVNLKNNDLHLAILRESYLASANLSGAYLSGADLKDAYLSGANLRGAYLIGTNLNGAKLDSADLREARLSKANLIAAKLGEEAKLDNVTLKEALYDKRTEFPKNFNPKDKPMVFIGSNVPLTKKDLRKTDLTKVDLMGANLSKANLDGANLSKAILDGVHLIEAELSGAHLEGVNLTGADLSQAKLIGAYLNEADLNAANLNRADLTNANLKGAKLAGDELDRAYLCNTTMPNGQISQRDCQKTKKG